MFFTLTLGDSYFPFLAYSCFPITGLEWNLKVTAQDMGHILEKFTAEFETYWNSKEFIPFDTEEPERFRDAIVRERTRKYGITSVFFDLTPHPFQERILDALKREREVHNRYKNLVIAATGTGKTVVAAFDFYEFYKRRNRNAKFLFVAHRKEILEQDYHEAFRLFSLSADQGNEEAQEMLDSMEV